MIAYLNITSMGCNPTLFACSESGVSSLTHGKQRIVLFLENPPVTFSKAGNFMGGVYTP